jgi:hypothetical protein
MPRYWMITNRNASDTALGKRRTEKLSYYVLDGTRPINNLQNWTSLTERAFRKELETAADAFPVLPENEHERQKHVTVFIHGYNKDWQEAVARYRQITDVLDAEDAGGHAVGPAGLRP